MTWLPTCRWSKNCFKATNYVLIELTQLAGVKPSLYAQYYFELRTLFSEIKGNTFAASTEWTLKPLSIIKARRLEDRSVNVWDTQKTKAGSALSNSKMSPITGHGHESRSRSTSTSASSSMSQKKGWQTFSPAQYHAHERLQMMGLHEESKGKNFNPYVFDKRSLPSSSASASRPDTSGSTCSSPLRSTSPATSSGGRSALDLSQPLVQVPTGSEFTRGWVCSDLQRGEEQVVRTFEDVTLTDISRFVLSWSPSAAAHEIDLTIIIIHQQTHVLEPTYIRTTHTHTYMHTPGQTDRYSTSSPPQYSIAQSLTLSLAFSQISVQSTGDDQQHCAPKMDATERKRQLLLPRFILYNQSDSHSPRNYIVVAHFKLSVYFPHDISPYLSPHFPSSTIGPKRNYPNCPPRSRCLFPWHNGTPSVIINSSSHNSNTYPASFP